MDYNSFSCLVTNYLLLADNFENSTFKIDLDNSNTSNPRKWRFYESGNNTNFNPRDTSWK